MSRKLTKSFLLALGASTLIAGCKVEANRETVPEAEGSGNNAVNIRVQPMDRQELREAAGRAVDGVADVAEGVRDVATSAAPVVRELGDRTKDAADAFFQQDATATTPSSPVIATPAGAEPAATPIQ